MKDTHLLSKFLSKEDIKFVFDNLNSLKEIRDEDNIFNRSIFIARREDIAFQPLFDKCDDVFFNCYNKKLLSHELYFIKYYKGDYIKRHNDNWNTKTSAGRLYSLVAQMTPPNEYSGGDTIVYSRYAGSKIDIKGVKLILLNDDEVLAVLPNPDAITQNL